MSWRCLFYFCFYFFGPLPHARAALHLPLGWGETEGPGGPKIAVKDNPLREQGTSCLWIGTDATIVEHDKKVEARGNQYGMVSVLYVIISPHGVRAFGSWPTTVLVTAAFAFSTVSP
jgi:hypothetical protein